MGTSDVDKNMHAATEAFILAWDGEWTMEKAAAQPRASHCQHQMLPSSMGMPPKSNEDFAKHFKGLGDIGINGKMVIDDYLAVPSERRAVARSSLKATTPVGPYTNEYVWFLDFDESGERIVKIVEFFDSAAAKDIIAKLKEAGLR